ncbi:hypothetical protein KFE25_003935 [Diacronema lutheri]|uniref:Uncharacterized protein n=1 Tax=Diacronema lutheri TaxID=2081491 RepID=A0A8J5XGS6_DIALT|nr:hypothetical protein KFE25_003935 [Diacronema lutheri]
MTGVEAIANAITACVERHAGRGPYVSIVAIKRWLSINSGMDSREIDAAIARGIAEHKLVRASRSLALLTPATYGEPEAGGQTSRHGCTTPPACPQANSIEVDNDVGVQPAVESDAVPRTQGERARRAGKRARTKRALRAETPAPELAGDDATAGEEAAAMEEAAVDEEGPQSGEDKLGEDEEERPRLRKTAAQSARKARPKQSGDGGTVEQLCAQLDALRKRYADVRSDKQRVEQKAAETDMLLARARRELDDARAAAQSDRARAAAAEADRDAVQAAYIDLLECADAATAGRRAAGIATLDERARVLAPRARELPSTPSGAATASARWRALTADEAACADREVLGVVGGRAYCARVPHGAACATSDERGRDDDLAGFHVDEDDGGGDMAGARAQDFRLRHDHEGERAAGAPDDGAEAEGPGGAAVAAPPPSGPERMAEDECVDRLTLTSPKRLAFGLGEKRDLVRAIIRHKTLSQPRRNWQAILTDPACSFDPKRTAASLKDAFRVILKKVYDSSEDLLLQDADAAMVR